MNIEFDEVVVQDVSDEVLELAAGGAQGGAYDVYAQPCKTMSPCGNWC